MDTLEFQLEFTYHEDEVDFLAAAVAAKEMVDGWAKCTWANSMCTRDVFLASWEAEYFDSYEEELVDLSKKFPDVVFEVTCLSATHSCWKEYFKNGMVQIATAVVTYDEFDEAKLHPFNN